MDNGQRYERFPVWMVAVALSHAFVIYALGVYILAGAGPIVVGGYVALCLGLELHALWSGCRNCFYYGKRCAFGRGLVCAWLFERGEPGRFAAHCLTWRDFLPDLLVGLVPLVGGIVLSVVAFGWSRVIALVALALLSFTGTAFVRGSIACRYCMQKDLGCPAQRFFAGASPPSGPAA